MKQISKIVTISVISSSIVLGANIPNSSTIQKQLQTPRDIPTQKKEEINIQGVQDDSLKAVDNSKAIFISDFAFAGNSVVSSDELKQSLKAYVGKELTYNEIQEVLAVVTKVYRDKGYFVARAYLGKQDLVKNGNVLFISVIEGKYDSIKLNNSSLVKDSSLQTILDNTKSNGILNVKDIQRALLLINDRNRVQVSNSSLEAGESQGSSNLNIETVATPRVNGYVVIDNYGSRYTGYNRLQALANINSPFNIGDKLSISGLVSNGADLKNGKLAYELPLNSYGLKSDFAYSRTNYNLVKEMKVLDANGNQDIYEVGLSYPLILKSDENLWARVKYYHKDFKDYMDNKNIDLGNKKIDSVVASLDYTKYYNIGTLPARVFANLNLTTGYLKDKLNSNNSGRYNKVDTYIGNEIAFSEIFSFNQTLTAQKVLGNKSLDGSEDISLGGVYGVRVYPYSEQNADNGYVLNFELLSKLPSISSYNHKIGTFYDVGDVYEERSTANFNRRTLQDVGIGYYSNYKDFFARVQMAWGINHGVSDTNESHRNNKLLLQAGWVF